MTMLLKQLQGLYKLCHKLPTANTVKGIVGVDADTDVNMNSINSKIF